MALHTWLLEQIRMVRQRSDGKARGGAHHITAGLQGTRPSGPEESSNKVHQSPASLEGRLAQLSTHVVTPASCSGSAACAAT